MYIFSLFHYQYWKYEKGWGLLNCFESVVNVED